MEFSLFYCLEKKTFITDIWANNFKLIWTNKINPILLEEKALDCWPDLILWLRQMKSVSLLVISLLKKFLGLILSVFLAVNKNWNLTKKWMDNFKELTNFSALMQIDQFWESFNLSEFLYFLFLLLII